MDASSLAIIDRRLVVVVVVVLCHFAAALDALSSVGRTVLSVAPVYMVAVGTHPLYLLPILL